MQRRRANPYLVKIHRSYTAARLATVLGVHKNTVRLWQRAGLAAIDNSRPFLFQGAVVRAFLAERNAGRKRPCGPGTLYCFCCRKPRKPALEMVDFLEMKPGRGNLRALCGACGTIMHRCARRAALPALMPGLAVQIREAQPRLKGNNSASLNCHLRRQVLT